MPEPEQKTYEIYLYVRGSLKTLVTAENIEEAVDIAMERCSTKNPKNLEYQDAEIYDEDGNLLENVDL